MGKTGKLIFTMFILGVFSIATPIVSYLCYQDYVVFERAKIVEKVKVVSVKDTTWIGKKRFLWTFSNEGNTNWKYDTPYQDSHKLGDTLRIVYNKNSPAEFQLERDYGTDYKTIGLLAFVLDSVYLYLVIMLSIKSQRKKVLNFFDKHVEVRPYKG